MHTRKILLAAAVAASLALAGCANDGDDDALADDTAATEAGATDGDEEGILDSVTAGESLALVMAVDQHEIDMAQQARDKGVTGDVLAYADMLHQDHSENLEKDRNVSSEAGIDPAATAIVSAQQSKGASVMERLAELEGGEYATAYVDAMVQGHTDALAMLDERLDTTENPTLRQHLSATREAVAAHLEQGKALQAAHADEADGE